MRVSFIIVLFSLSFVVQAGDRLEGISGSMNNSGSLFGWFGDNEAEEDTAQESEEELQLKNDATSSDAESIQLAGDGCVKEKVYTLDVENADQYERIEDFPFTYECVQRR